MEKGRAQGLPCYPRGPPSLPGEAGTAGYVPEQVRAGGPSAAQRQGPRPGLVLSRHSMGGKATPGPSPSLATTPSLEGGRPTGEPSLLHKPRDAGPWLSGPVRAARPSPDPVQVGSRPLFTGQEGPHSRSPEAQGQAGQAWKEALLMLHVTSICQTAFSGPGPDAVCHDH